MSQLSATAAAFVPSSSSSSPAAPAVLTKENPKPTTVTSVPSYMVNCFPFVKPEYAPPPPVSPGHVLPASVHKIVPGGYIPGRRMVARFPSPDPHLPLGPPSGFLLAHPPPMAHTHSHLMVAPLLGEDQRLLGPMPYLPHHPSATSPLLRPSILIRGDDLGGNCSRPNSGGPCGSPKKKTRQGKQGHQHHQKGTLRSAGGVQSRLTPSGYSANRAQKHRSTATIRVMDSAAQTDFPDDLADCTLDIRPNSLFQGRRASTKSARLRQKALLNRLHLPSTDTDEVDSDSGYCSPLHLRNMVSNGNHPMSLPLSSPSAPPSSASSLAAAGSTCQNPFESNDRVQEITTQYSGMDIDSTGLPTSRQNLANSTVSNKPVRSSKAASSSAAGSVDQSVPPPPPGPSTSATPSIAGMTWAQRVVRGRSPAGESSSSRKSHPADSASGEAGGDCIMEDVDNNNDKEKGVGPGGADVAPMITDSTPTGTAEGDKPKRKRKRTRRRKRKSGEPGAEGEGGDREDDLGDADVEDLEAEEINLKEDNFPGLGVSTGRNAKVLGETSETSVSGRVPAVFSYRDAVKKKDADVSVQGGLHDLNNTPVKDEGFLFSSVAYQEESLAGVAPLARRRKRREQMTREAEEEVMEIRMEQELLHKMAVVGNTSGTVGGDPSNQQRAHGLISLAASSAGKARSSVTVNVGRSLSGPVGKGPSTDGKKYNKPMSINLMDMIAPKKQAKKDKGGIAGASGHWRAEKVRRMNTSLAIPANPLDATAPLVKRGVEREQPKAKKPSALKKVILKERELRKQRTRFTLMDDVTSAAAEMTPTFPSTSATGTDDSLLDPAADKSPSACQEMADGVPSTPSSSITSGTSPLRLKMEVDDPVDCVEGQTPVSQDLSPISQGSPINVSPPNGPSADSTASSPIAGMGVSSQRKTEILQKIHSRRFREYCDQMLDKEIDTSCTALLQDLVRFQSRQYGRDPIKARTKRRFVLGIREVTKHLRTKKIKLVIVSPNLEKIQSKGGLDDALYEIFDLCSENNIPFIFALGRRALGQAVAKKVPVSVVGVFNYDGSETNFKHLMDLTVQGREKYQEMVSLLAQDEANGQGVSGGGSGAAAVAGMLFAHLGHSRTPSAGSGISFTSSYSEPISEQLSEGDVPGGNDSNLTKADVVTAAAAANGKAKGGMYDIDEGNEADTEEDFAAKSKKSAAASSAAAAVAKTTVQRHSNRAVTMNPGANSGACGIENGSEDMAMDTRSFSSSRNLFDSLPAGSAERLANGGSGGVTPYTSDLENSTTTTTDILSQYSSVKTLEWAGSEGAGTTASSTGTAKEVRWPANAVGGGTSAAITSSQSGVKHRHRSNSGKSPGAAGGVVVTVNGPLGVAEKVSNEDRIESWVSETTNCMDTLGLGSDDEGEDSAEGMNDGVGSRVDDAEFSATYSACAARTHMLGDI